MGYVQQAGTPTNLTSSGVVSKEAGSLIGFHVNSTSSGTIVIRNGATAAGTAISGTITPAPGFTPFPAACNSGCYATLANTIDVTFFFAAG